MITITQNLRKSKHTISACFVGRTRHALHLSTCCLGSEPTGVGEQERVCTVTKSAKAWGIMVCVRVCACVMTVWCGGYSLRGVGSSSLGTKMLQKQVLQSANRTTRCADHHCPHSNLSNAIRHTHTHRNPQPNPVTMGGTHTHTSTARRAGGHTAETFMSPSDLNSV